MGLWDVERRASNWFFKLSPDYKEYITIKSEFESLKHERDTLKKELDFRIARTACINKSKERL